MPSSTGTSHEEPARPPPAGPLPDPPPSTSNSTASSTLPKQRTIVPKSSTINAKTNYVSPYRQQTPSRSVSTPLLPKTTSVTNTNSPNFKNIVSRFNETKDEKIPNPSNRIPAVAAGPAPPGFRTRKTPQWKPAGGSGNGNGQQPQQQTGPRSNSSNSNSNSNGGRGETPPAPSGRVKTERSMSAHDIPAGGAGGVGGLQRTRARKMSEGMLKSLPPLDTTVNDRHLSVNRHRRSRSALQLYSPSAASMADTEELDDVQGGSGGGIGTTTTAAANSAGRSLRHRRSRSDVGSYGSPEEFEFTDMIYTASPQEASPRVVQAVRTGIPLPKSRIASPTSPGTKRKVGRDSKAETLAPIAVSSHGSRRSPQPISSPRLQAYISAPLPAKSPPLRSSRQRLQQSAGSAAASSRQKFQNNSSPTTPSSYAKDVGIQRGRGARSSSVGENRGRDIKKKIPELGTVDFAARRARIQSAFNKTLKETNEGKAKIVPAVRTSKHSMQGEFDCPTPRSAVSHRIDEEDEDEAEKPFQPQFTNQADMQAGAEIGEEALELPTPIDIDDDSDSPDEQPLEAVSFVQEDEEERPVFRHQVFDRPASQASSTSTTSDSSDSSSSFDDDLPAQDTISPMSRQRPFSLIEPKRAEPSSIPLIVTPDSPGEPPFLAASTFLRPNSNWSGYSIDSEYTREPTIPEMPAHHMFDSVGGGVAVEPPTSDQQDATTSPTEAYIPIMLSNTLDAAMRGNIMAQVEVYGKAQTKPGLSPVPASVSSPTDASNTPVDTIVGVFEDYDEPREDFFNSYENTPVDYRPRDRYSGELELVTPGGYQVDDEGGDQETETEMDSGTETGSSGETETEAEGTEAEYQDTEAEYTETEGGYQDETETEGEYSHCDGEYDEQYDSTSCSEMPDSAHPGLDDQSDNQSDGWTSASASPEMEDHPARRLSMQLNDSPTTPRQYFEEIESPLPPTPPPKDSHFLPAAPVNLLPAPVPPAKDPPRAVSPSPSAMSAPPAHSTHSGYTSHRMPTYGFPSYPLQLPEIQRDTEPLGLAIQVMPDDNSPELPPVPPNKRPGFDRWNTVANMENTTESARPSLEYHHSYQSSRQSLDQYSNHRPSLDQYPAGSPSSSFHSEIESRLSNITNQNGNRHSETPASSTAPTNRGSSSIHSQDQILPQVPPEQKMLIKRRHLLKELVDTESSYFRDMTVAMEIYKGSANACAAITMDDIKVLFGNTEAIVAFSKSFLESLRKAVKSVYVMQRARSGVTSSAASISNSIVSTDDRNSSSMDDFAFEEEKDRKTFVGEVFMDMFYQMEKVYGEYCKNHDAAVGRLAKLESNKGIAIWLSECKACAEDLTNAWNLESLLIKPVQRILKYPLLLTQLLECTPRNHPDFIQLEVAAKEMKFVADRINEMKKRKDMVEKIVGRKRQESDIGHGITKAFARQAEKLKQSVGLSEVVVDETYNKYFENYNMHFVQVQVIIRDIEIYKDDIQGHVDKFLEYTQTIKEFIDVSHSQHPEVETKWRKFDSAMRELATSYLAEHKHRVQKHSIEPLTMLLKLHESPQRIMTKRNKKAVDYARFKAIIERGDTPDKKTKDLADAYLALNETLIDELPKLFKLTKKMVDAVLLNFVELQGIWMNDWASKIKMTFPEFATLPVKLEEVVKDFTVDFSYNEQSLNHLGICNGSMKAKYMSLVPIASPSMTTLSLDAFDDGSSYRRPSTATEEATRDSSPGIRDRAMSLTNNSPTAGSFYDKPERFYETKPERRYSGGGSTLSPLVAMGTPGLNMIPQVAQNLAQNSRNRATSVALPHRSPSTSSLKLNPQVQRSFSERQTPTRDFASRPSSRTYSLAETIFDGPETHAAYASSAALVDPRVESRTPSRTNSPAPIFSSAMPMDDDRDIRRDDTPSGSPMMQSRPPSRAPSIASSMHSQRRTLTLSAEGGGFPYLTYVQGEIFDVVGTKGEIWLAKNQDDKNGELGWIWCKHFAKL
ncbi:uncharacterized protein LAJ45_08501 [Morchella importuna]|uniref:uncharacterized protein n=1 Tax=Morchella importuna TaxID=1174673 RepID=UPI001E8E7B9F|nr:uncharacterized protein LAJ45_08501 [Morchella importuna]KAH8147345.1 hypothetical protein LAJ45_08501 [Morchella importuna]